MTALDPYPTDLDEVDAKVFHATGSAVPQDPHLVALNRIAIALEHVARALAERPAAPVQTQSPTLTPLPPVAAPQANAAPFDGCPIHQVPWKVVPAGISKKSGKSYDSFRACSVAGCDQRPPR